MQWCFSNISLPGLCRWQWGGRRSTNGKLMITCEQDVGPQHPLKLSNFVMCSTAAVITWPGWISANFTSVICSKHNLRSCSYVTVHSYESSDTNDIITMTISQSLNASKLAKVQGQACRGQPVDVLNGAIVTCRNRLMSLHDVAMLPLTVYSWLLIYAKMVSRDHSCPLSPAQLYCSRDCYYIALGPMSGASRPMAAALARNTAPGEG